MEWVCRMKNIGERLRYAREKKNLKQIQVMKLTQGKINNKTLSGYENNVSEPDIESLKILSELYEVSIDWLIGKEKSVKESTEQYIINDQARYDVIKAYNRLPQDKQKLVDDMIKALLNGD